MSLTRTDQCWFIRNTSDGYGEQASCDRVKSSGRYELARPNPADDRPPSRLEENFGRAARCVVRKRPQMGAFELEAGTQLTDINVKFTAKELELLSRLATDQLFRREFIDSRMHGYKLERDELDLGKRLVLRLREAMDRALRTPHPRKNGAPVESC